MSLPQRITAGSPCPRSWEPMVPVELEDSCWPHNGLGEVALEYHIAFLSDIVPSLPISRDKPFYRVFERYVVVLCVSGRCYVQIV